MSRLAKCQEKLSPAMFMAKSVADGDGVSRLQVLNQRGWEIDWWKEQQEN